MSSEGLGRGALTIRGIAYELPKRVVTNEDLAKEQAAWNVPRVAGRTGVSQRHIAGPEQTALDLAVQACAKLFDRHPSLPGLVDGIIFCTQTPDYVMPPNATLLQHELGLTNQLFALDTSLACSGFVYSLSLAEGLLATGTCTNVLVVTGDTYSKLISREDRSTRSLFGDGAAATWVSAGSPGLIDAVHETSGVGYESFFVPAGAARNPVGTAGPTYSIDGSGNGRHSTQIHMNGMGVLSFVSARVPGQIKRLLERNALRVEDIDLFVLHQASKLALDKVAKAVGIPPEKDFRNLDRVGNTVSASIPIALADAVEGGAAKTGDLVLVSGFGVGLSWASALIRI